MTTHDWREQTSLLNQDLQSAIAARESTFKGTIPDYLCLNNLKSKLARLEIIEKNLSIDKYVLVFIGTVGEGKTTAICHLFNLLGEFSASKTIGGKARTVKETQELLATGSGRRTICEVILRAGAQTYMEVEPYSAQEMESMILDFCDSLTDPSEVQGEPKRMLSKEIETAIRNVIQLPKKTLTTKDGDKPVTTTIDRAKEELERSGMEGLKAAAIKNANLDNRKDRKISYSGEEDEGIWIKRTFARLNDGEVPTVAIPRKILVCVSETVLSGSALSQFQAVVDTKGLDENPIRKDLEEHITKENTICLFATGFKDAPETNIRELMRFYLSSKSRDFHHRFVTFVIPHKGDAEKVNGGDGSWDVGTQIRREDIQSAFKNLNLEFFPANILFYDALRYYRADANVLDASLYGPDDTQRDRRHCLEEVGQVIDRRRTILLQEVRSIGQGFQRIKEGQALSEKEVQALEVAVQKIKGLLDLGKRIPSFVYEEFVERYVTYYRNNYPAWNTKHAINRRFGTYDIRQIDIFYDARVVAQGESDEEMLRKFTKEPKTELEGILLDLTQANQALSAFIPDLVKQFDTSYDEFIAKVGNDVEGFLHDKLSPLSEESDFWQALISEKGKQRAKGETYTDNVCQTYRRELESAQSLNAFLEARSKEHWKTLVAGVLSYFGEQTP
jgi:hypothetical protein